MGQEPVTKLDGHSHVVLGSYGPIRMRFLTEDRTFQFNQFDVGHCLISSVDINPVAMMMTGAGHSSNADRIKMIFVSRTSHFQQNGITHEIAADACLILDSAKPYTISHPERTHEMSVYIPRDSLSPRHCRLLTQAQVFLPGTDSFAVVTHALLHATVGVIGSTSEIDRMRLGGTIVKLIGDMLESKLETFTRRPMSFDTLRLRIKSIINAEISNPDLSISEIAKRVGCSVRYLYRAFEVDDITPSEYVRNLRLENAKNMLSSGRTESLAEIAYRSGFRCYAHFSRAFHSQYGASPREWRNKAVH